MLKPNDIIPPGIYSVIADKKKYHLEFKHEKFKTPKRIYGTFNKYPLRFFKTYKLSATSVGVMLIGAKGSGKTLLAELISNLAIENKMAVIWVYGIKIDDELMKFLSIFNNAVIYIDEFGKLADIKTQDRALTAMSSTTTGRRLFIITENNKYKISEFIRDRPGRMKYCMNFDRVDKETFEEYVSVHNVRPDFYKKLKEAYNKAATYSFDELQAVVSEHLLYPDDTFEELSKILNVRIMGDNNSVYRLVSIVDAEAPKDGEEPVVYNAVTTKIKPEVIERERFWIDYRVEGSQYNKNIEINKSDIVLVNDTTLVYKTDGKIITFTKGLS